MLEQQKKQSARWWSIWVMLVLSWVGVCLWLKPDAESRLLERLTVLGVKPDRLENWSQWQEVVRANFVHLSWEHLSVNALSLMVALVLWRTLKAQADALWLACLWLMSGVGGFVASGLWGGVWSAGASAGVHGVYAALSWRLISEAAANKSKAWRLLVPSLGLLVLSLSQTGPGIDHVAHQGGAISGLLLGCLHTSGRRLPQLLVGVAALTMVLGYWSS